MTAERGRAGDPQSPQPQTTQAPDPTATLPASSTELTDDQLDKISEVYRIFRTCGTKC
jgi:hypothetical protein